MLHPPEIVKSLRIYSSSFYGSCLWDLSGFKAKQVFSAWNTSIKLAWGCPQQTRSYLVQQLLCCGFVSAKTDIVTRFVKFFHGLRVSASHEVQVMCRYLARDRQSVTGKNLWLVHELTNLNPWTVHYGKLRAALQAEQRVPVPDLDRWRLPYLMSLLRQRREAYTSAEEEHEKDMTELIEPSHQLDYSSSLGFSGDPSKNFPHTEDKKNLVIFNTYYIAIRIFCE